MITCYLDTSVLLAYTLARTMEPTRYQATARLFALINDGLIRAVTSFYALHELLVIAISNTSPDWERGSELAKEALRAVLNTQVLLTPIPRREEKLIHSRRFASLHDATDLPHAIAAFVAGCTIIVAYDEHFRDIDHIISYCTPEELIAEVESSPQAYSST